MSPRTTETDVRSLQRRAEHAIRAAKPRDHVVRLLEELAAAAADGSEPARFAHRHLAELRLEESPWRAALHLRRVLKHDADDDIAQALMGLCQALQGNFRCAVAAYRRAVALAPANPWYNHNLGHLLDVALGKSRDALPYLRRAYRLEPSQDEVAASLAHCLGRLDARDEALELARGLVRRNPGENEHRTLLHWLEQGAPASADGTMPGLLSAGMAPSSSPPARPTGQEPIGRRNASVGDQVERLLTQSLGDAGRAREDIERARMIWRDYLRLGQPVLGRPVILAAAVEYALARVDGMPVKQKDLAERHGVSLSALQTRYAAIRSVLNLGNRDGRYRRRPRAGSREDEPR